MAQLSSTPSWAVCRIRRAEATHNEHANSSEMPLASALYTRYWRQNCFAADVFKF